MTFFTNTSTILLTTMMAIAIIQIDIFGTLGLFVYGLLIAYGIIFIIVNFKNLNIIKHPIFYIACAYYIYFILAEIINGNFTYTGPSLIQFFILTIIAFRVRTIDEIKKDFKILAKYLTIMGLIVSISSILICIVTYYIPDFVYKLPEEIKNNFLRFTGNFPQRATGVIGNANRSAGYIYICSLFALYLIVIDRRKIWVIPAVTNILLAFYSTFIIFASRTYMVCLLITLPGFFIAFLLSQYRMKIFKQKKFYITACAILFMILCIILIYSISDTARNYILNHIIRIGSLSTGSGRLEIYKTSINLWENHKLFGYNYMDLYNITGVTHAHNIFIEVLASGGLPSFILFSIFMIYTIYIALKNVFIKNKISTETRFLICLLISYMIGYLFTGMTGGDINRMMYTTVILPSVMCSSYIIREQINKETNYTIS